MLFFLVSGNRTAQFVQYLTLLIQLRVDGGLESILETDSFFRLSKCQLFAVNMPLNTNKRSLDPATHPAS